MYASTLIRLRHSDPPPATLALVAGVALEETAAVFLRPDRAGDTLRLKWPNDLMLDDAKVAGVLLERTGDAVVIGIGVNIVSHPQLPDRATTALADHGVGVTAETFVEALADTFARWVQRWRTGGLLPVRDRWVARAHPIGTALAAQLPDHSRIDGLFDGLDADGALILRLADGGRRVIHAADVFTL